MACEVPQQIRERLVAAIDDLRNAVGQEAAKAVLVSLTNIEPVALEPETTTEDGSWLEFINEDFMIDSSEPLQSMSPSPVGKFEDQSLQTAISQTGDKRCDLAVSLYTANPTSPMRIITSGSCEHYQEPEVYQKRGRLDCNILEAVAQSLLRRDLLDCLETQWQSLTTEGIYMAPSRQVLTWNLDGSSEQTRRLQSHLILRHLDIEDDLHQWRRSIAERRNLDGYNSFFAEVQAKQRTKKHIRRSGERSSSKAQIKYLAHLYADRTPRDYNRAKQGLQKDLRNGRRWSILIDGFVTDDGNRIPGLGLGFLLLCGSATARKMSFSSPSKELSADGYNRYNTTKYSDPYWKALLVYVNCSRLNIPTMCEIMRPAAESLVYDGKLRNDTDLNAIAVGLEAVCLENRNQMGTLENGNQNGSHLRTKD